MSGRARLLSSRGAFTLGMRLGYSVCVQAELPAKVEALGPGERARVGWIDRFGLSPFDQALREGRKAIAGNAGTPPTRWGLTSTRIFKPHISFPTWLGRTRADRRVPIYNFFNRNQPPKDAPYSVEVTFCRDWRGGQWTYDSHVGTDFAVPVGTPLVTPAPGKVLRVDRQLDRGGLGVLIDHGQGLITTSAHMSKALVEEGQMVGRGDVIGLSGAAGLEFILFFPWVAPHLHLNVWLNGEAIDPFATDGEVSLWRERNDPRAHTGSSAVDADFAPSRWDPAGVEASIEACRDQEVRDKTRSFASLERRAAEMHFHRILHSACFTAFPQLFLDSGTRRPCLDLPFRTVDFVGIALPE